MTTMLKQDTEHLETYARGYEDGLEAGISRMVRLGAADREYWAKYRFSVRRCMDIARRR